MKTLRHYSKDFLNYLNDALSDEGKARFETALENNPELQAELDRYRRIIQMEQESAKENFELDERFVSKVMAEIRQDRSLFRRVLMKFKAPSRPVVAAIGSVAMIALCVSLVYGPEYQNYLTDKYKEAGDRNEAVQKKFSVVSESESAIEDVEEEGDISENVPSDPAPLKEEAAAPELLRPEQATRRSQSNEITVNDLLPSSRDSRGRSGEKGAVKIGSGEYLLQEGKLVPSSPATGGVVAPQRPATRMPRDSDRVVEGGPGRPIQRSLMPYPDEYDRRQIPTQAERYGEFIENAPVLTSTEPMSTFSIDVDTGSYTNARRFLQQGAFPPAEAVRVEEFINYFEYDYPSEGEAPFAANFEAAPAPGAEGTYLLKIGVQAQQSGADGSEKPWNLVFLVDISGSMNQPNKLPLVQRSLELLVNKMRPQDKVSIVTYAGSSGLLLPPTGIAERQQILQAIKGLRSGGSTYGSAGIQQAYRTASNAFMKDGVNRVILATDGDFNVGVTSQSELIRLIEEKRKSGITLTTLGFGTGNYNEAVMEQLANKGNGNHFYIDNFREARKVFEEDLYGTIEMVAKDVKLQIEFNPAHVAQYRLIGYENRKLRNQDFANDRIDAGEIGAGHSVTAFYELVLTGTEAANRLSPQYRYKQEEKVGKKPQSSFSSELAFLKIRYKEPDGNHSKLLTFPLNRNRVKEEIGKASQDFQFAAAVSAFAHKLRESQYASDISFDEIAQLAFRSKGEDKSGYRHEFIELVKNAAAIRRGR